MKTKLLLVIKGLVIFLFFSFGTNVNGQISNHSKIEINSFQVVKSKNKIAIRWTTDEAAETNYFEVEKSTDGKNFKTIAYVLGPDPARQNYYGCFDKMNDNIGKSFYRLKHVNIDGIVQFSDIKMLALK